MREPPTGTVTFLLADIAGSVRLWDEHPEEMGTGLARHEALLHEATAAHDGHVVKLMGDQFCVAFECAITWWRAVTDARSCSHTGTSTHALLREQPREDGGCHRTPVGRRRTRVGAVARSGGEGGVGTLVRFVGQRGDVPTVLAAMDILVLTSLHEGGPLAILEAMAAGHSVVTTPVGLAPYVFARTCPGAMVREATAPGLAQAILSLARSPQERRGMGAAARCYGLTTIAVEQAAAHYHELYQPLVRDIESAR